MHGNLCNILIWRTLAEFLLSPGITILMYKPFIASLLFFSYKTFLEVELLGKQVWIFLWFLMDLAKQLPKSVHLLDNRHSLWWTVWRFGSVLITSQNKHVSSHPTHCGHHECPRLPSRWLSSAAPLTEVPPAQSTQHLFLMVGNLKGGTFGG